MATRWCCKSIFSLLQLFSHIVAQILGVDILASIFTLFGWLAGTPERNELTAPRGGWTDIVTVVRVW